MKDATFIDFDDSFSWNVIQELETTGFTVKIVHWMDFETLPESGLLVLGPGPGHPDDYQRIYPLLKAWLERKKPFFGLCLGHQIFWRIRGENVYRSKGPMHGQKVELELSSSWQEWLKLPAKVKVQRYNSLTVLEDVSTRNPDITNLLKDGEVMMSRNSHVITYQFHPESVGTSFRQAFFRPLSAIFV